MKQHNPIPHRTIPTMLTTTEVMAILRVTRATLCSWCRAGKVPHVRMPDSSYLFDAGAITTWIAHRSS
jgi:predicted site-specific integrase-resolvase